MKAVSKCVNAIKANPKAERLFAAFCEDSDENYVRLLLYTEVRWLSKGNCLQRFMELFDAVTVFLGDIPEVLLLRTAEGKAIVSYFADIFGKLDILNRDLQGPKATLVDAKTKVCAFISKLRLFKENINRQELHHFSWLLRCAPLDDDTTVTIAAHLDALEAEFNKRFADLKALQIPCWFTQSFITELADVAVELQEEIAEVQNDLNALALHKAKSTMM